MIAETIKTKYRHVMTWKALFNQSRKLANKLISGSRAVITIIDKIRDLIVILLKALWRHLWPPYRVADNYKKLSEDATQLVSDKVISEDTVKQLDPTMIYWAGNQLTISRAQARSSIVTNLPYWIAVSAFLLACITSNGDLERFLKMDSDMAYTLVLIGSGIPFAIGFLTYAMLFSVILWPGSPVGSKVVAGLGWLLLLSVPLMSLIVLLTVDLSYVATHISPEWLPLYDRLNSSLHPEIKKALLSLVRHEYPYFEIVVSTLGWFVALPLWLFFTGALENRGKLIFEKRVRRDDPQIYFLQTVFELVVGLRRGSTWQERYFRWEGPDAQRRILRQLESAALSLEEIPQHTPADDLASDIAVATRYRKRAAFIRGFKLWVMIPNSGTRDDLIRELGKLLTQCADGDWSSFPEMDVAEISTRARLRRILEWVRRIATAFLPAGIYYLLSIRFPAIVKELPQQVQFGVWIWAGICLFLLLEPDLGERLSLLSKLRQLGTGKDVESKK